MRCGLIMYLVVVAFILSLLSPCLNICPNSSDQISYLPDITSCEGSSLKLTFNITGLHPCGPYEYKIELYHHDSQQDLNPVEGPVNSISNICVVTLTVHNIKLSYNDSLAQILIIQHSNGKIDYCSNNFTLLVQGPPDPVIINSTLNCTGVLLTWLNSSSLPECPVLYYTITILEVNITNITTSTSIYYLLSDIFISNEIYTVTISATNGASTGNETMYYFNTSLVPQVILTHYHIEVDPDNPHNTVVIFRAQVINVDCTPSYPTHLSVNITCEHYSNYSDYNITVTNNGSITINEGVHLVCPLDQFNCSANFIWSNLNLSSNTLSNRFNTSQIQTVDITPVTNGIRYQCHFLPYSILWGCGITVISEKTNFTSQNTTTHIASGILSNLCPGIYNVTVFAIFNQSRTNYSFKVVIVNGDSCRSTTSFHVFSTFPTVSDSLGPIGTPISTTTNSMSTGLIAVIVITCIVLIVLLCIAVLVIIIIVSKCKNHNTTSVDLTQNSASQEGTNIELNKVKYYPESDVEPTANAATTGSRETIFNDTIRVSNGIEERGTGILPIQIEEISAKGNYENVDDSSNEEKQYKEKDFLEAKDKVMPSSSSTSVLSTELKQVASQDVKSQGNVDDDFNQTEKTEDHFVKTEEVKVIPPPSSSGTLPTETESLQGVKENHKDISEEDNHIGAKDAKVIRISSNNSLLSTETEQQMSSLAVNKIHEDGFNQEEHKEDNLTRTEIISPSSSSNTLTTEAKQVESQAVIEDSFNEQNVNKEDTGDYPTGLEETGKVPSSSSTGSLSTEPNQMISQAVEESVVDNFSQKEMVYIKPKSFQKEDLEPGKTRRESISGTVIVLPEHEKEQEHNLTSVTTTNDTQQESKEIQNVAKRSEKSRRGSTVSVLSFSKKLQSRLSTSQHPDEKQLIDEGQSTVASSDAQQGYEDAPPATDTNEGGEFVGGQDLPSTKPIERELAGIFNKSLTANSEGTASDLPLL